MLLRREHGDIRHSQHDNKCRNERAPENPDTGIDSFTWNYEDMMNAIFTYGPTDQNKDRGKKCVDNNSGIEPLVYFEKITFTNGECEESSGTISQYPIEDGHKCNQSTNQSEKTEVSLAERIEDPSTAKERKACRQDGPGISGQGVEDYPLRRSHSVVRLPLLLHILGRVGLIMTIVVIGIGVIR